MDLPHIAVARLIGRGSNCLQHSISYLTPNQLSLLTQSQYHLAANFSCQFQIIFTPVFIDNNLEFWWGTFTNTDINFYNFTQSKIVRILFVILIRFERLCSNQGVREKARVFETLNFFGKGLTQIETDVQLL